MELKTILNRVQRHSSFVYGRVCLVERARRLVLEVEVHPRANSRARCSGCAKAAPGYDRLPARRFEFVPLWGIGVFLLYAMRRVQCPRCGVKVESVPWASGKHSVTDTYAWFLARWARRLSWKEVAEAFHTPWDQVFRAVEMAVEWGRARQDLSGVGSIGVDEIAWQRGHRYLTVVYQIDEGCRRLLWVGKERRVRTLLRFFRWFGPERSAGLRFICSDMWRPYLKVIAKKASAAVHVLDRYHIMAKMSKAIDEVRATEAKALVAGGYEPVLKRSRWLLLKRPENLTERQEPKLAELLQYNLRSVRAYLLKEDFQLFWEYVSPYWAGQFLDRWCRRTPSSGNSCTMKRSHSVVMRAEIAAESETAAGRITGWTADSLMASSIAPLTLPGKGSRAAPGYAGTQNGVLERPFPKYLGI